MILHGNLNGMVRFFKKYNKFPFFFLLVSLARYFSGKEKCVFNQTMPFQLHRKINQKNSLAFIFYILGTQKGSRFGVSGPTMITPFLNFPVIFWTRNILNLARISKSIHTQFSAGQRTLWLKNLQISHVTLLKRSPLQFIPFNLRCTKGSCWYRFLLFRQMMPGAKISPIFIQEVQKNVLKVCWNTFSIQRWLLILEWIVWFGHANNKSKTNAKWVEIESTLNWQLFKGSTY